MTDTNRDAQPGEDVPPLNAVDSVAFFIAHEVSGPEAAPTPGMFQQARALLLNLADDGFLVVHEQHVYVEVEGAETCLTHIDGVMLETGPGYCDMCEDNDEDSCKGGPLYRAASTARPEGGE